MPKYQFTVPQIWEQTFEVEADSPAEAKIAYQNGKAEAVDDNTLTFVDDHPDYDGPEPVNLHEIKS